MLEINKIYNEDCMELVLGDCIEYMRQMADATFDLTVTSPPYDNLRTYEGNLQWNEDVWKAVLKELYRVTKVGGVVVWVVGDATIKGSETGTSFKQALWAKECGFNLHDTMIYRKQNYMPLTHPRYEQEFEYMFVFSKGKPKTFNPIMVPCKYAGSEKWSESSYRKKNDGLLVSVKKNKIKDYKQHGNIFEYLIGSMKKKEGVLHPAIFPEMLASDQIKTWSNAHELVFDPFMGSGTTGVACLKLCREFIGVEIEKKYYAIAKRRLENDVVLKEVM